MNLFLRILAVLAGIVLILPGLCTLGFGGFFTISALPYGGGTYGIPMIAVGGLFAWLGWLLIRGGTKK